MDQPLVGALGCNWTPRQSAENALRSIARVRTVFPDVIVADIEPVLVVQAPADWLERYADLRQFPPRSPSNRAVRSR
jgi:hypothetical protein